MAESATPKTTKSTKKKVAKKTTARKATKTTKATKKTTKKTAKKAATRRAASVKKTATRSVPTLKEQAPAKAAVPAAIHPKPPAATVDSAPPGPRRGVSPADRRRMIAEAAYYRVTAVPAVTVTDRNLDLVTVTATVDGAPDGDALCFGATSVIRTLVLTSNREAEAEVYSAREIQDRLGLHRGDLVAAMLLLGSDFDSGVPLIGPAKARTLIRQLNVAETGGGGGARLETEGRRTL